MLENLDVHISSSDHFRAMWYPHTDDCLVFHLSRTTKVSSVHCLYNTGSHANLDLVLLLLRIIINWQNIFVLICIKTTRVVRLQLGYIAKHAELWYEWYKAHVEEYIWKWRWTMSMRVWVGETKRREKCTNELKYHKEHEEWSCDRPSLGGYLP